MSDCILYFVKYPHPGEVKTRLADGCSAELAAEFYRVFARKKLVEIAGTPKADVFVCYFPETMRRETVEWLGASHKYISQKGADLGRRMENAFREVFFMGYDRVVLVGSDIPGLTPDILRAGLDSLNAGSACIGPAGDGGYYLVGFHRHSFVPEVFHDMQWSREEVGQRTVNRLLLWMSNVHVLNRWMILTRYVILRKWLRWERMAHSREKSLNSPND